MMPSNDGVLFNHHADLPKAERFKRCLNHDSPDSCRANRKLLDKRLIGRLTRSMVDRPGLSLFVFNSRVGAKKYGNEQEDQKSS